MKERHCRKTVTGNGQLNEKLWKKVITFQFDHFKVTHSQSASYMSRNSDTIETHFGKVNNFSNGLKIEILKESINGIMYILINLEVLLKEEKVEKEGKQTEKCFYFFKLFLEM